MTRGCARDGRAPDARRGGATGTRCDCRGTREEAERRIKEQDEPYKLEILNRIKGDRITIYHASKNQDGWWDLCAGPHVATTGDLPKEAIALESIAGAYLFGDENGPMLQVTTLQPSSPPPPHVALIMSEHIMATFLTYMSTLPMTDGSASTALPGRQRSSCSSTSGCR